MCTICIINNYAVKIRTWKHALIWHYIDMNTKLSTETKEDFEKDFFKLINNSGFEKSMEIVKKCLFKNEIILKSQQKIKSKAHTIYILKKLTRMH